MEGTARNECYAGRNWMESEENDGEVETGTFQTLLRFYMDDVAGAGWPGQTARIGLAVNDKFLEKYRMGFIQHPDIFQKFIRAG
jgi:hypothetical protein